MPLVVTLSASITAEPPDAVPVCVSPLESTKTFPEATSDGVAVTTEASVNFAVPPPTAGRLTAGTSSYSAPSRMMSCIPSPPFELILRIFVTESCVMTGTCTFPVTVVTLSSSVAVPTLTTTP